MYTNTEKTTTGKRPRTTDRRLSRGQRSAVRSQENQKSTIQDNRAPSSQASLLLTLAGGQTQRSAPTSPAGRPAGRPYGTAPHSLLPAFPLSLGPLPLAGDRHRSLPYHFVLQALGPLLFALCRLPEGRHRGLPLQLRALCPLLLALFTKADAGTSTTPLRESPRP